MKIHTHVKKCITNKCGKCVNVITIAAINDCKERLLKKVYIMFNKLICGASLICAVTFANAGTITLTDTISLQKTNYNTSLSFAKFDDMGGTKILESVSFSIEGTIQGEAKIESGDSQAATIVTTLSAELKLIDAMNNSLLVVTIPSVSRMFEAEAFDGSVDYAGGSGITYDNLNASQFEQETYTAPATLAFFTGAGTAAFSFEAAATSLATGSGNLSSDFTTAASGVVDVVYTYRDIPILASAPSSFALLGLALLAFFGIRQLRK
jgi:hypothetical protein